MDDIPFSIPEIKATLRDPNQPIIQSINSTIEYLNNYTECEGDIKDDDDDEKKEASLHYIGGVDISHGSIDEDVACAGIVVLEYPSLKEVYRKLKLMRYTKPYIAGFLAFREVDFLLDVINEMKNENSKFLPDIILVDGNGILHHRGFGLASHLGVLCGIPTIGIGKNLLMIDGLDRRVIKKQCDRLLIKRGDFIQLIGNTKDKVHGVALRCGHKGKNAIFISIGHRISWESAIQIALLTSVHKLPEPIRFADLGTREFMRNYEADLKSKEVSKAT